MSKSFFEKTPVFGFRLSIKRKRLSFKAYRRRFDLQAAFFVRKFDENFWLDALLGVLAFLAWMSCLEVVVNLI